MNVARQQKIVFFGVGATARWVASLARDQYQLFGTTRDTEKIPVLKNLGIEPRLTSTTMTELEREDFVSLVEKANVLVTFPPDGHSDQDWAVLAGGAKRIIYISSTGVYGRQIGEIDESVAVDDKSSEATPRIAAENIWKEQGAIILRPPALYSRETGLHLRLRNGTYRLPGDGSSYTSRIHLKDLARLILAAFEKPLERGSTYVVGDLKPARQKEVVTWLSSQMKLSMPESVPLSMVSTHLSSNRRITPTRILKELGIELEFPTYKEGFLNCLEEASSF
jgi:hypothetical protein